MSQSENINLSRRNFIKLAGMGGTALCIGLSFISDSNAAIIKPHDLESFASIEMNPWMSIDASGKVTIVNHRSEMGQGSYQSVPQIVAEELEVDLADVNVIFAQGNKEKYGNQITGGSSTIRGSYKNLLKLGATAREMLIAAAAAKWNVSADTCYAKSGHVFHKATGKKFHYGELVQEASKLEAPKNVKLKKRSEYKLISKPLLRKDTPMKTNGSLIFGLDKRVPGMVFAAVERSPRLRGKMVSFDDSEAKKIKGVTAVFPITMKVHNTNREGVVVVANNSWAALQGKKALKIIWDDSGFEHISSPEIYSRHQALLQNEEGLFAKTQGDPNAGLKNGKKLDVTYQTPYQSHYAMEPVNCVAHFQGDKVEIWGPIQAPDWIQESVSKDFNLKKENVIVNMTFLGGGFGRKAFTDYPNEAVAISKKINAPVQVVWSREDDASQGPFRPGVSYRAEGAIENGTITSVKFRMAGQNIDHWQSEKRGKPNGSTTEGFLKPYFDSIKNISFADIPFETPIPVLWWRSVYASTNGFAYESFMDELAHEAQKDPLQFRREHLKEDRVQKLIDKLEEVSGWKNRKKNEGYGMAITECFATTVGQIVKVSKNTNGGIKIDKVWAVMDCGWYVNPDIIQAQVEGSIIMALGAATLHEQTFKDGLAEKINFYDYQIPRIHEIPQMEVHIMENDEDAGGVGEPALPPFAPALTNAIFDLTGKRIRKLPFNMAEV